MFTNYKTAGLLSIVAALITIPLALYYALTLFAESSQYVILNSIFILIQTIVVVLVVLYLKHFLEEKIGLTNQKNLFLWICILIVFINILGLISAYFEVLASILILILAVVPVIPLGILYIILGMRILKIKKHSIPYVNSVAYLTIVSGYLNATVIFSDLNLIIDLILNIFLALMFFSASKTQQNIAT